MALRLYSYRRFVVLTMLLLISATLFHPTFSGGCGKSATKRGRLSMEYQKVEHHEDITVVHSTSHQTSPKLQIQGESASQENGQSRSLRLKKIKPKFQCKRQIPGGPDPQHH